MRTERAAAPLPPLYPRPARQLSVALELPEGPLPGWLACLVEALDCDEHLQLCWRKRPAAPAGRSLYSLYQRIDRRLLGPLGPVLSAREPRLAATSAWSGPFDVVLGIGAPGSASERGRLATWTIPEVDAHPDTQGRWMLPGFLREPLATQAGLRLFDEVAGRFTLIEPGVVAPAQLCFARHRAYQLQKAPAQLLRALRRLAAGQAPRQATATEERQPGLVGLLQVGATLLGRCLAKLARRGQVEHWWVAVRRSAQPLDPERPGHRDFRHLEPPRGWFWADPMPWQADGRDYVLVEALEYRRGIGEIHALELDAEQRVIARHPLLRLPVHLSFPVPFRWNGATWLWVESAQARRISVLRAERFPDCWVEQPPLLDGWRCVDASPFEHAGRWWMFVCVAESPFDDGGREWNELFLFHAESPLGPWHPHPGNPVCTDVRCARPAGPVFRHLDRLIRPAQDCSGDYGRQIVFREIELLDTTEFRERTLSVLQPDSKHSADGCHTYARCGALEVLDFKQWRPARQVAAPKPPVQ